MANNFFVALIAALDKKRSKKQIEADAKNLGNIYVPLIGKLNQTKTQQNVEKQIKGKNVTNIELTPTINSKALEKVITETNRQTQSMLDKQRVNVNIDSSNAHQHLYSLGKSANNTSTVFGKLRRTISNTFNSAKIATTSYLMVLNQIYKASSNAKQAIKEIDSAITDLSIATNESRESVGGLIKDYNAYAKDLASTTTQITTAADDYLRAGKSLEESQALIKDSIMLSKLGKLDSSEATEDLLATMNGFKMSVDEVDRALDAMVAVDMQAATSAGDLATALKYSASSADMAEVSFNKLIAMIGTTQDATQQSAETIGTFMNTVLSRYRNVKIGQLVDDDGEDISEVETVLKALDIQLRDSSNEFRSFEVIIDEVASKWNNYSNVQQAAISKAFSGTRQQNRFIALMEGYNKVLELTEVAANSAGTAVEKFNNSYLDSLEAKENTLQASFESMVMNSDMDEVYSGIIEATTALVDFINKTNLLKGVFSGLTLGVGIKAFLSLKTGVTEAYVSLNQFQQALNLVKNTNISNNGFARLLMLSKNLSASQTKLILSSKNLTVTQKKQILMNQGLSASEAKLQLQNLGLTTSYTGLKASMVSVTNACKGLFNTLLANPLMLVATAISAATMAFESYKQSIEEANERAKESAQTASTLVDDISTLTNKYLELSNAIKTDESAKDDLISTQNELLEKLGLEGESIDSLITKYGSLSEAIRQARIDKLRDAQIDLLSGLNVSENDLLKVGKDYEKAFGMVDRNLISSTGKESVQAFSALEKHGLIDRSAYGSMGGSFVLTGDDSTIEGTLVNYEKLQDALRILQSEFSATDLKDNDLFNALKSRADEMKDSVESYKSSLEAVNKGASQIVTLEALKDIEIPDTKNEFETFRKELIDTAVASQDFIGTEEEITKAIDAYLATIPNFKGFFSTPIEEEINDVKNVIQGISLDMEEFRINTEGLQEDYKLLTAAVEEYNETNALSMDTITSLMDSGLIQYLEQTENGIKFNTDAFLTNADAIKDNAIQQLYNAMCHDVEAISMGNVDEVATGVKTALENAGIMAKQSGEDALLASDDWFALGTSVATTMTALGVDNVTGDAKKQIEETISYYKNLANIVTNGSFTNTDSSSNKSSKDKHLEAYKEKLSILENELDQELITQKEFYTKSEALLNEYLKDTPKHIDTYAEEISDAEKKLHDVWNDAYEYDKSSLDKQLENGTINAHDYAIELENLINEYYVLNNATQTYGKYTDELIKAQEDLAKAQKDSMEQSISAITMLIDKQIKKYEDAKESAEKAHKAQIKAIEEQIDGYKTQIESYDKLIDKKDDEIKKLNEINEAHNTAIQLQKEQQALDNALNNKSVAKLVDGQIKYVVDDSAVKESRESLDEIHHQQAIDALEKEKELLEESKESIESQIDLLEKQQDTLEKTLEKSNEYFDNLIESLNDSKDRISEVLEIQDNAKLLDNLKSTLGEMDLSINDIYNMSDSAFEKFKQSYLDKLSEMSEGNTQLQESMAEIANMDATETSVKVGQVATGLVDVAKAAENASKAIKSNDEESTSLTSAIDSSFDSASEKLPLESEMLDGVSSSAQIATENTNLLKESIDSLTDKTVTITVVENHVSSSGGGGGTTQHIEAYAKGSKRIPYRQEGWTQEDGFELVFSPSRNAVLTKLEPNDMVLTHEMSENIWQWGKLNPDILKNSWSDEFNPSKIANVVTNNTDNRETNVTFNVSMPNVTNDTSARELINNLKSMSRRKYQYFN